MNIFFKIATHITNLCLHLLCLSSLVYAQNTEVPEGMEEKNTPPITATQPASHLINERIDDNEKIWLNTNGQQHQAYYLPDSSDNTYGGVILIPDLGQHPAAKGSINDLRITLADNHWHTLALNVSGITEQQTQQLITAGINYFNQLGVYNLAILGEGLGAAQALCSAALLPAPTQGSQETGQVRAVLMINGSNHIPNSDVSVFDQLEATKIPILDAFVSNNYRKKLQAAARKKIATKSSGLIYQQIILPQTSNNRESHNNRMTQRIRGWLDKNAAGFMVKSL